MNIATQLFNHLLSRWWVADHLDFLTVQVVQTIPDTRQLFNVFTLLLLSVETDQSFKDLVGSQVDALFLDLLLEVRDVLLNFCVVFLHRFIKAEDRLGDFFFEVGEKPLNDSHHLVFGLMDPLFELILLLDFLSLMFLHVKAVVVEFLDSLLEKAAEVSHHFVHAE